jgi:acyl-CoA synthetase (AMP-forming)/AMP-acid ligase II
LAARTLIEQLDRAAQESAAQEPAGGLRFLDRAEEARWLSWAELRQRAIAVASRLQALGLRRGERVALIFPTGEGFFDAFFGTLLAGGVPSPLYPPVRFGRLEEYHRRTARMVELAGAALILSDSRVLRLLGETAAAARPRLGCLRLQDLPEAAGEPTKPIEPPRAEDLGLIQFSSGTTVDPKPVALSHRALLAQVEALNTFWPDQAEVRHTGVSWLPLYHDMGLIGCVFAALAKATELTLLPPELFVARPALWLRAISTYRATVSPAPNFAYGLCVNKIRDEDLEGVDLSSWQVALNGAEPVSAGVLRAFLRRFAPYGLRPESLSPVYGLAEAALAVTFSDLRSPFRSRHFRREALAQGRAEEEDGGQELVSVGRPLPGFALSLRGANGQEVEPARVGRLWVRGPSLMDGYLDQPEATAEALQNGWLDTGDEGFLFDGELYLTGRAKDMLILRGRNLAPQLVEQAIEAVEGVRTGCSVAVSAMEEGGETETLFLFVETTREAPAKTVAALPEACRRAVLAAVGVSPDPIVALAPGTLPRTSSGKLRRQEALRLFRAGELLPPAKMRPWRLAAALGRSAWALAKSRRQKP